MIIQGRQDLITMKEANKKNEQVDITGSIP
jgi:hypothetical protein